MEGEGEGGGRKGGRRKVERGGGRAEGEGEGSIRGDVKEGRVITILFKSKTHKMKTQHFAADEATDLALDSQYLPANFSISLSIF